MAVECKNKSCHGIKPQSTQKITEYYTYHHLIFPRKGWKTLLGHQKNTKSPSWMLHLSIRNIPLDGIFWYNLMHSNKEVQRQFEETWPLNFQ